MAGSKVSVPLSARKSPASQATRPVSPPGLRFSTIWGGRGMLEGSARVALAQDDFVFLRPTESEGVFLQFGDILVYDGQEIATRWPTFPIHA